VVRGVLVLAGWNDSVLLYVLLCGAGREWRVRLRALTF
jgi:hypothetical protein